MDETEREKRRAETTDRVVHMLRSTMRQKMDDTFLQQVAQASGAGLHSATTSAAGRAAEDGRRASRLSVRTFVCQECNRAFAVGHGASIKCPCGAESSAELLPR